MPHPGRKERSTLAKSNSNMRTSKSPSQLWIKSGLGTGAYEPKAKHNLNRVSVISAKNHKHQRRKRQSLTAKREKSQTPKVLTAILTLPNLT